MGMSRKIGKISLEPKYLVLALMVIILVSLVTVLSKRKQDNTKVTLTPSTVTEEKKGGGTQVEIADGIYTNYEYRFTFRYPADTFFPKYDSQLITKNGDRGPILYIDTPASLSMGNSELINKAMIEGYEACKNVEIGMSTNKSGSSLKILERDIGCMAEITPESYVKTQDGEPSFGYYTYFKIENGIVSISLISWPNGEDYTKYYEGFKSIFESFQLLE